MEVEGSFDNWSSRQVLQRTGKDFTIIKLLQPGMYQVSSQGHKRGARADIGTLGARPHSWLLAFSSSLTP